MTAEVIDDREEDQSGTIDYEYPTETTERVHLRATPPTRAPFEILTWGSGPQLDGSTNHVALFGWNPRVFVDNDANGTPDEPALFMGMEDGFLADGDQGSEWYVAYFSPDHETVELFRPFYCRVLRNDDGDHSSAIYLDIGEDGTGAYAITAGSFGPVLFEVTSTQVKAVQNVTLGAAVPQVFFNNSLGGSGWVEQAPSVNQLVFIDKASRSHMVLTYGADTASADTEVISNLRVRGATTLYDTVTIEDAKNINTGTTTGTKIGTSAFQKLGFWGATPQGKGAVDGSRGGNAALQSLLVLLAQYGLVIDNSTA